MKDIIYDLKGFKDERGLLVAIEGLKTIPFEIKRTYYLVDLKKDYARGFHAHKELIQFAVCLRGSCRFVMDDGVNKTEYLLDSPQKGILIEPMIWHEMHDFSSNCVLLVFASDHYNESDYIRDYQDFKMRIV